MTPPLPPRPPSGDDAMQPGNLPETNDSWFALSRDVGPLRKAAAE
jgi:hypothetical protein